MPTSYLRGNRRSNKNHNKNNNNNNKSVAEKASLPYTGQTARSTYRMAKGPIGSAALSNYQSLINMMKPVELKYPYCLRTFERMKQDDAVMGALLISYVMIEEAFKRHQVTYKAGNAKSKSIADFIKYQLDNISDHSFLQAIKNIETFKEKGFSVIEKNYERPPAPISVSGIPVLWKIKSLANRPQLSLADRPFDYDDWGSSITNARQDLSAFYNNNEFGNYIPLGSPVVGSEGYVLIPRHKFMLFGDNATDSNPYGNPLLASCWKAWKEKVLLEDLEMNGVSKDLAGVVKLTCPSDIIYKANLDPNSPEADQVRDLLDAASAVHAGEAAYVFLPSDMQKNGQAKFDFSLQGIDGNSKNYTTSELIAARRKAIYDTFGAGALILGDGQGGSRNLSDSKTELHTYYVRRDLDVIEDVLNRELVPQLLLMNNIYCAPDEVPKIQAGAIDRVSLDEIGKLVQRFASVNMFAATKENIIDVHRKAGLPVQYMENMTEDELLESLQRVNSDSRAGEGQGTSGTGNSQTASGGDNNLDNKSSKRIFYDELGYYRMEDGQKVRLSDLEAEFMNE